MRLYLENDGFTFWILQLDVLMNTQNSRGKNQHQIQSKGRENMKIPKLTDRYPDQ
jgi:hypothetical protein